MLIFISFIFLSLLFTYLFFASTQLQTSVAMIVSVSSDGKYAVSSHLNGEIMLWNIARKTQQKIADKANCYSAYFIKNSPYFMWQDLNNTVHVQDINDKTLLTFHNKFPVYGHVMTSDLKHYFASDQSWNLYMNYGVKQKLIKSSYGINGFLASGKLLNLSLSQADRYLISSGDAERTYDSIPLKAGVSAKQAAHNGFFVGILNTSLLEGIVLWNANTGEPIMKFSGNEVKTFAVFSPNNQYVVTGDENQLSTIWLLNGKKHLEVNPDIPDWPENINIPLLKNHINAIYSLRFIDGTHYLRFIHQLFNYVVLYDVNHQQPLKLIFLGNKFSPAVNDFSRDEAIDSAPFAHIVVTGLAAGSGIIVYQYDPAKQLMRRIWVVDGPAPKRVAK